MRIEVELFATLTRFVPDARDGRATLDIPEGATVADVARRLGLPPGFDRVALVNGREADDAHVLSAGDVLTLYPPLAGGAPSF